MQKGSGRSPTPTRLAASSPSPTTRTAQVIDCLLALTSGGTVFGSDGAARTCSIPPAVGSANPVRLTTSRVQESARSDSSSKPTSATPKTSASCGAPHPTRGRNADLVLSHRPYRSEARPNAPSRTEPG